MSNLHPVFSEIIAAHFPEAPMSKAWQEEHQRIADIFAALDWPTDGEFSFHDSPGEHDPCFAVMPGGASLGFNHHAGDGVDIARARFVVDACNEALRKLRRETSRVIGPNE